MAKETTEEYRSNMTIHLTRISGDIEHIKENIVSINENVKLINGRLRKAENNIIGMKSVGFTLYAIIGIILTWLGIKD
jgi:hypothetical protein